MFRRASKQACMLKTQTPPNTDTNNLDTAKTDTNNQHPPTPNSVSPPTPRWQGGLNPKTTPTHPHPQHTHTQIWTNRHQLRLFTPKLPIVHTHTHTPIPNTHIWREQSQLSLSPQRALPRPTPPSYTPGGRDQRSHQRTRCDLRVSGAGSTKIH
jgi:hypothetical protein